jgi:AraC-like DNA-binding protein
MTSLKDLTVAAAGVAALLDFAASKGARVDDLSTQAGIDRTALSDPDSRVPLAKYLTLLRAARDACRDPAFALHFGEAFNVGELSVGGLVTGFAGSMAESFALMNRYARLSMEVHCSADDRLIFDSRGGELWMIDTRIDPNAFPEITETTFARIVTSSRGLGSERQLFNAVTFTFAEPPYRAEYERIFRMPMTFGSGQNALRLDPAWSVRKPPLSSAAGLRALTASADELLTQLDSARTTSGRVQALLTRMLPGGGATVEGVARELAVSRQTLFRRLREEGTSFEKVLDDVRRMLALQYLRQRLPVSEAAYLVGFSSPTSFSRAVKRWTGSTPREMSAKSKK